MRRSAVRWIAALGVGTAAGAGLLIACDALQPDDPQKDVKVNAPTACDVAALPATPLGSAVKAYVEASRDLATKSNEAVAALRDGCLEIYKDTALGIAPPPNADTATKACQPLFNRLGLVNAAQPTPPALNSLPPWALLRYAVRCNAPAGTKEACLTSCAAEECTLQKCEPGKIVGKCLGECLGTCTTTQFIDGGVECSGECFGEVPIPKTPSDSLSTIFGGTCDGECSGTCNGQVYSGKCQGGCSGVPDPITGQPAFTGLCAGTCHGTCNKNPLPEKDAGANRDAGTPVPGELDYPPVLNDNPGNCGTGTCEGTCSDGANGTCFGRCITYEFNDAGQYFGVLAPFVAGECKDALCVGDCRSAVGTPAAYAIRSGLFAGLCRGECRALTKPKSPLPTNTTCLGICRPLPTGEPDGGPGFCAAGFEPGSERCEGELLCNQNVECDNACEAKAALAAVCDEPLAIQAYAVTDPALYNALRTRGTALGKAAALLEQVRKAYAFIGNRSYGDFVRLEPEARANDLVFKCAQEGAQNAKTANDAITPATAVDPTR